MCGFDPKIPKLIESFVGNQDIQVKVKIISPENYKEATFHEILMDEQPEAKGFFMAFAVPTFIVYSGGQEILRTARHISVDESRNTLDRYYGMIMN